MCAYKYMYIIAVHIATDICSLLYVLIFSLPYCENIILKQVQMYLVVFVYANMIMIGTVLPTTSILKQMKVDKVTTKIINSIK